MRLRLVEVAELDAAVARFARELERGTRGGKPVTWEDRVQRRERALKKAMKLHRRRTRSSQGSASADRSPP